MAGRTISADIDLKHGDVNKYITEIDDGGIKIHPKVWENEKSYIQLDGNGMYIKDKDDNTVATYTDKVILGRDDRTQSYMQLDFNSLKMIDKGEKTYFNIEDLRDKSGKHTVNESLLTVFGGMPDGIEKRFVPSFSVYQLSSLVVSINNIVQTRGVDYTYSNAGMITFTNAPATGDIVTAQYDSNSPYLKIYTLGYRSPDDNPGAYSFVEGYGGKAGNYAHAEGIYSEATGIYSHAEGNLSVASGPISHAEGWESVASGFNSHAEGSSTASGEYSHSEGYKTEANGKFSHAQGFNTKTDYELQTAIGQNNNNKQNNAFEIGNGEDSSHPSNAFEVDWDGNIEAQGNIVSNGGNITDGVNNLKNKMYYTDLETVEHSITGITASSGTQTSATKSVSKSGYFPLGVVGWRLSNGSGSGGSYGLPHAMRLSSTSNGSATIAYGLRAVDGNVSNCTLYVTILWVKIRS